MKRDVRLKIGSESVVDGAKITGNVVVITGDTVDYGYGDWIAGIDNSDGYVIVGDTDTSDLIGRSRANGLEIVNGMTPTFWKSKTLSDQGLLDLINRLPQSPGNFTTITSARAWFDAQGKYVITNDYNTGGGTFITGDYKLSLAYAPAPVDGDITFPAHPIISGSPGSANNDPNLVGTEDDTYAYQIYINVDDLTGTDQSAAITQLAGNSGELTLTQNSDYVTYSFTNEAFRTGGYGGSVVYYDTKFQDTITNTLSPLGSLTVIRGSEAPFNTEDPITITINIL